MCYVLCIMYVHVHVHVHVCVCVCDVFVSLPMHVYTDSVV